MLPLSFKIACRYVAQSGHKHFIGFISRVSMLGIALGVMVLITVMSVMNGFPAEIQKKLLHVTPHITAYGWQPTEHEISVLKKMPAVSAVCKVLEIQGMLSASGTVKGVYVQGVQSNQQIFDLADYITSGSATVEPKSFGIILGDILAQQLGVEVGDKVSLVVPDFNYTIVGAVPKIKQFTVTGLFHVNHIYDYTQAFIDIQDAKALMQKNDDVYFIQMHQPFNAPVLRDIVLNRFDVGSITDWTLQNKAYFEAVRLEKNMMFVILMLIIGMAIFNVVSTLVMVVTDKKADIAILRMQGATKRCIQQIFLFQGMLIGLVGTLVGTILGIIFSVYISTLAKFVEKIVGHKLLSSDFYFIDFLPSKLVLWDVIIVVVTTLVLSVLAALYPAIKASHIEPAKALRDD